MAPKGHNPSHGHHAARPRTADRTVAAPAEAESPASPVPATLVLPLSVVSRSDVSKALREIGNVDDYFHQASIRGTEAGEMPTVGRALDGLAKENKLNLVHAEHRAALKDYLTKLKASAPVVHVSFPSAASDPFIAKILGWFRENVHPNIVLHVGLQPELSAGALVRTTNKMFDFSLRKRFEEGKKKLIESIAALDSGPDRTVIAESAATVSEEDRL